MKILLGVTASVAIYKSLKLVRLFKKAEHEVRVVMTEHARDLINPLLFQAISGHAVRIKLFDLEAEQGMSHIELARWPDVLLIAPATANILAELAHGFAKDLLSTLYLATPVKTIIAPAMNQVMWAHPATRKNVERLKEHGVEILIPDIGSQACGDVGAGRMMEPVGVFEALSRRFKKVSSLVGKRVVITAGPTREPIDPVRYLSNRSSGKMGYAIAKAASEFGAEVILVSGPVSLAAPLNVQRISVTTAAEMLEAVLSVMESADLFIGCAAVSDYRVETASPQKLKKQDQSSPMQLTLMQNPDILQAVRARRPDLFVVGFAAETENLLEYGRKKRLSKGMDMIAINDVSRSELGFETDENALWVIDEANVTEFPKTSKTILAEQLLELISENLKK